MGEGGARASGGAPNSGGFAGPSGGNALSSSGVGGRPVAVGSGGAAQVITGGGKGTGGSRTDVGGGMSSNGGSPASGGAMASGGRVGSGGALGSGGAVSSGGALGSTGGQAAGGTCVPDKIWSAGFAEDPTQLDGNGDNVKDWRLRGGGTFLSQELVAGVWHASANQLLDTAPANAFSKRVLVSVRMRHTGSPGDQVPAVFWINVNGPNPPLVSVVVELRHEGNMQTLRLMTLDSMSQTVELDRVANLPDALIEVGLDIAPSEHQVALTVAGVSRGTFQALAGAASPQDAYASLWSGSGGAEFGSVSVTLCTE